MPFYFVLETLPNLRHAVTIFALGMRLKSKRRKTIAAFETVLNGRIYQIKKHNPEIKTEFQVMLLRKQLHLHKIGKIIVFEDTFYSFFPPFDQLIVVKDCYFWAALCSLSYCALFPSMTVPLPDGECFFVQRLICLP